MNNLSETFKTVEFLNTQFTMKELSEFFKKLAKEVTSEFSDKYVDIKAQFSLDWSAVYYEGESPDIQIEFTGTKRKT